MLIEKSVNLPASQQKVWQEIENIEGLIWCMPGVEKVEALGNNHWNIILKQKVGFISVTFNCKMKITSSQPQYHLDTVIDADAMAGLGKAVQNQSLDLVPLSENETLAKYKANVALSGKIGAFGQRVLGGKVEELSTAFIKAFTTKLTIPCNETHKL
jgi:uncharacterized protein